MNNIRKKLSIILIIFFILVDGNTAIKDSLFATVGNKAIARSDIITEIKIILILSNQSFDEKRREQLEKEREVERLRKLQEEQQIKQQTEVESLMGFDF